MLTNFLKQNEGKEVQLSRHYRSRTSQQNRYLWSIYNEIALETGYTSNEIHEYAKLKFLPRQFVDLNGEECEIPKSTRDLSTEEFVEYTDRLIALAGDLGISLPPPDNG